MYSIEENNSRFLFRTPVKYETNKNAAFRDSCDRRRHKKIDLGGRLLNEVCSSCLSILGEMTPRIPGMIDQKKSCVD
jgi:hypothetical protein